MCPQMIVVNSITYAIRSRDLLRMKGYKVHIDKMENGNGRPSCSYAVCVNGDIQTAAQLLNAAGIKILNIVK